MRQLKSKSSSKARPSRTQAAKSKKAPRNAAGRLPLCFVIMPFGQIGSEKEQHYDIVYEHVIKRAVRQAGFDCLRADEIPNTGPIPERVKEELRDADLVLADLSDRNPNVFYELGFRHALGKPSITISDDVSTLPFNLSNYSTIQYTTSELAAADIARDNITKFARALLADMERRRTSHAQGGASSVDLMYELRSRLDQGFSNVYQLIGEQLPTSRQDFLKKEVLTQTELLTKIQSQVGEIQNKAEGMLAASRLLQQTADLGLVNIYANRMDAFENEFFTIVEREEKGLDIVGSTLFGLKGHHQVDRDKILSLLKAKYERPGFVLRILMTHWDYISHRQDQEKTEKNITRYVISKELKEAVELIQHAGLAECVRFYRAAPTCFTVICRGQGLMLVNPYPYQKEAYNSWTAIFRETRQRAVYDVFSEAHFDQPWANESLAIPFSAECVAAVAAKLRSDLRLAQQEISATYSDEDED